MYRSVRVKVVETSIMTNTKDIRFSDITNFDGHRILNKTSGDKVIWGVVILLVLVSLLVVYSATGSLD